jgi:hypothetical protein
MTVSFIGGRNWRKPPTCYQSVNNLKVKIRVMVFNDIFNNISVISGRSVLLVEESGKTADTDKLDHIALYRVHLYRKQPMTVEMLTTIVDRYSTEKV